MDGFFVVVNTECASQLWFQKEASSVKKHHHYKWWVVGWMNVKNKKRKGGNLYLPSNIVLQEVNTRTHHFYAFKRMDGWMAGWIDEWMGRDDIMHFWIAAKSADFWEIKHFLIFLN